MENNSIHFKIFTQFNGLIHGFSTRAYGSMKPEDEGSDKAMRLFSKDLGINPENIIGMQQIHSKNVAWVTQKERGLTISQTDGLLTKEKQVFLSVVTADCIPVFMFDKQKRYAGVVHAGWKGIYSEIIKAAINQLILHGSDPSDILIGIGPCIRSCCYNISGERAEMFKNKSGGKFLEKRDEKIFLDLPKMAKEKLISVGIPEENIEDCGICTFDNPEKFFSYRREGEKAGRLAGIIGTKH